MLITKGAFSHVGKLDGAFGACIHEPVAALRVKLCSRDNLGQLLHVSWLDVNNIEALILDVQVPEVYSQIVTADKGLPITVHRDAVDVVGVSISIGSTRDCGHHCIVMGKAG